MTNFGIIYFTLQAELDKAVTVLGPAYQNKVAAEQIYDAAATRVLTLQRALSALDPLPEVVAAKKDPPIQGVGDALTQSNLVDGVSQTALD